MSIAGHVHEWVGERRICDAFTTYICTICGDTYREEESA